MPRRVLPVNNLRYLYDRYLILFVAFLLDYVVHIITPTILFKFSENISSSLLMLDLLRSRLLKSQHSSQFFSDLSSLAKVMWVDFLLLCLPNTRTGFKPLVYPLFWSICLIRDIEHIFINFLLTMCDTQSPSTYVMCLMPVNPRSI